MVDEIPADACSEKLPGPYAADGGLTLVGIFHESLERCLKQPAFLEDFYLFFLDSSPEVRALFSSVDMARQRERLGRILLVLDGVTTGERKALQQLASRADSHSRGELNIRPELYDLWSEAILAAAEKHDPEWTDESRLAWALVVGQAVDYMVRRY